VVVDERQAAFYALGLALETAQPVVCISTSGSAPAHYYPAVLEAFHSGVPLILVTADRPEELRGVGANQTTDQENLFGQNIPCLMVPAPVIGKEASGGDVAADALTRARRGTPVQVNVAFREPLSSPISPEELLVPDVRETLVDTGDRTTLSLTPEPGTLVVAGHGAGAEAEALALGLGAPLIAEVSSGARYGPHVVLAYRDVLNHRAELPPITRVITYGRPTLSRDVWSLLGDGGVEHVVVRGSHREVPNPSRAATVVDQIDCESTATPEQKASWVKPWVMAGRSFYQAHLETVVPEPADRVALASDDQATRSAFARAEMQVLRRPVTRWSLCLAVWEATWPHDRLVFGASRMIREADHIVPGKNISVRANRGLSGIDGTIATARGIARGASRSGASGITRVLLGDLTFLHDVGSLFQEPGVTDDSRVHLIVANDGGGSIFDQLEVSAALAREDRDRVLFTPHAVNIAALATAYGWDYQAVTQMGELTQALSRPEARLIIDVSLPRE
jgi:2-succinyl-5-enolpyruvyl-6-hydroxy-3-cyclohexene-1-carboxylate synthase